MTFYKVRKAAGMSLVVLGSILMADTGYIYTHVLVVSFGAFLALMPKYVRTKKPHKAVL